MTNKLRKRPFVNRWKPFCSVETILFRSSGREAAVGL